MAAHNDLTNEQNEILSELYNNCNETLDSLPYTDTFDNLYSQFLIRSGLAIDRSTFWKALSNARKASKLVRKKRI